MTMQATVNQIGQIDIGESLSDASFRESIGEALSEALGGALSHGRMNNFVSSVNAYADMSPDLSVRKDVNTWMIRRDRQSLDLTDWCALFGNADNAVLAFIYESFSEYSGLDFSYVRPNDSLNSHLKFPLVCWFDWSITFCEAFFQAFDVDLSDRFDEADFITIGELANFLVAQV